MSENVSMGSVEIQLMNFINTAVRHDGNVEIAQRLLEHYQELKELSIDQIAQLCYVSKASISRFCRMLGYPSFKDLRDRLELPFSITNDYTSQFLDTLVTEPKAALASFAEDASQNVAAVISPENLVQLPEIARTLHDARNVAFFSHHFLWDAGRYLQDRLVNMGRYMEAPLGYHAQLTCAEQLRADDLAIVCSIGGSYPFRYPAIFNKITESGCQMLAITQNESVPFWNHVVHVLRCGSSNRNETGKYGALAAVDLITLQYLRQYGPLRSEGASRAE